MKFKRSLIFIFVLFAGFSASCQIRISESIQPSAIAKTENNSLYFIDFWATWCAPCLHVAKYLETLQSQYPNDFYIVSLSQENQDLVKRFLLKYNTKLAVAIDYEGETFKKNNIESLPYGILYNARGDKLWEGHPANFKPYLLKHFYKHHKDKIEVNTFFKEQSYDRIKAIGKPTEPQSDFEYEGIPYQGFQVINSQNFVELKGSLQDILCYVLKVYKTQVHISESINESYKMTFKKDSEAFSYKAAIIYETLGLSHEQTFTEGDVYTLKVIEDKFWDTNQINWEGNFQSYLISDSEIQADNVSVYDMAYKLSWLLEKPITFVAPSKNTDLHDWQIHYKYFELMRSNLLDDYGIQIELKSTKYPKYVITKKAP